MKESVDDELNRAFKESAGKSLAGWEFTPAMQRKVLSRIQAEGTGTVSAPDRPARRRNPAQVLRPLAWTAVAAAALLVAVNTDLSGFGGSMKKSSAPTREVAESKAPAPSGATPAQEQQATTLAPATNPARQDGNQTPPVIAQGRGEEVAPPPEVAAAGLTAPTGPVLGITSDSSRLESVKTVALEVPAETRPKGEESRSIGIAAAHEKVGLAAVPETGRYVELSLRGARALLADGAEAWFVPLEGVTGESLLAVSPTGQVSVSADNKLYVVNASGRLESTFSHTRAIESMAWGEGNRLAAAFEQYVWVYRGGVFEGQVVSAILMPELAYGPDGTLAVFGTTDSVRTLSLYGKDHRQLMKVNHSLAYAKGLAFSGDGQVVLAGGQAYGRSGNLLWQVPFETQGALAVPGSDRFAVWDAHTVALLGAGDGMQVWRASWNGSGQGLRQVVPSLDGRFVAIVASTGEGWVFWVLDSSGKLLLSDGLSEQPAGVTFAGARLMLLTQQGVEFREIPQ